VVVVGDFGFCLQFILPALSKYFEMSLVNHAHWATQAFSEYSQATLPKFYLHTSIHNHIPDHCCNIPSVVKSLDRFFYWLTDYLIIWLMPSDKRISVTVKAGLISSLFNIALFWDVPFCQLQQLKYSRLSSTKAYPFVVVCSPLLSPLQHRRRLP